MDCLTLKKEKIEIWDNNEDVFLTTYNRDDIALRPAVIICPGGGYLCISESESEPVAYQFAKAGYHPFVLNYSVMEQARFREEGLFKPMLELAAAMDMVSENAERWYVNRDQIAIMGFSAGGHLAAYYCTADRQDYKKPAALLLAYPLIDFQYLNSSWSTDAGGESIDLYHLAMKKVFGTSKPNQEQLEALNVKSRMISKMPPVFLWQALDDKVIAAESSVMLEQELRNQRIPCQFYLMKNGIHGEPFYDPTWFPFAVEWLRKIVGDTHRC